MEPEYMDMEPDYLKTYFIYTSHEDKIMQIKRPNYYTTIQKQYQK